MPSQRPGATPPKGKKNKGKSRAPPPPAGPKQVVTPKRRRRKPKSEKGNAGNGEVVDLTLEEGDLVEVDDGLDTPDPGGDGGGTRALSSKSDTMTGGYAPTAFTPLSRSILSGMARVTPDETDIVPAPPTSSPEHDTAASTEPHHTADIVIEEIPRSTVSASTKLDRFSAGQGHDHFDPPGLFSTSLMPTLVPSGSKSPHVELRPSEETVETSRDDGSGSNDEEQGLGLLLPSHVMLDTVAAVDEADEEDGPVGDTSMEGLHFVDDDVAKVGWFGNRHSHLLPYDSHVWLMDSLVGISPCTDTYLGSHSLLRRFRGRDRRDLIPGHSGPVQDMQQLQETGAQTPRLPAYHLHNLRGDGPAREAGLSFWLGVLCVWTKRASAGCEWGLTWEPTPT